jgi:hypothetical protein
VTTSSVSAAAVNGTTPTSGTLEAVDPVDAPAEAPDVTINPPVNFPDHYPDEAPGSDEPTAEEWAELSAIADEVAAKRVLDLGDRLTLDELIQRQAEFYESWGNYTGKWLALHMTELLIKYRGAGSPSTPAEAMARIEVLEQDMRHDWKARGYEEGKADGLREAAPYNGPLD